MSKILLYKEETELYNRDGCLWIVKDEDERCFLVLEANTFHNQEVFEGMGSTQHIEISPEAFTHLKRYE